MLDTVCVLSHFTLTWILWGRYTCPYFTGGETEVQMKQLYQDHTVSKWEWMNPTKVSTIRKFKFSISPNPHCILHPSLHSVTHPRALTVGRTLCHHVYILVLHLLAVWSGKSHFSVTILNFLNKLLWRLNAVIFAKTPALTHRGHLISVAWIQIYISTVTR